MRRWARAAAVGLFASLVWWGARSSSGCAGANRETTAETATSAALVGDPLQVRLLAYNLLYQYRQVPNPDGSYPGWVCRMYPYVVDHPELRWDARFPAIAATIARERPDILGLSEMRGGLSGASPDPQEGPAVIADVTGFLQSAAPVRYRWVSVADLPAAGIEVDPSEERDWLRAECRPDMSSSSCDAYDVRADRYSTKSYLAYRADRYRVVRAGALELATSAPQERRFAPWAILRHESGGELMAIVAHLDPMSEAHRVESVRRLRAFIDRHGDVAAALLGDLNADAGAADAVYRLLTSSGGPGPTLVDTYERAGGTASRGTALTFGGAGNPNWPMTRPCWPASLPGEGHAHLPPIRVETTDRRTDYILVTPGVTVVAADIVEPVVRTIDVEGHPTTVIPSDHLPVTATVRIPRSAR